MNDHAASAQQSPSAPLKWSPSAVLAQRAPSNAPPSSHSSDSHSTHATSSAPSPQIGSNDPAKPAAAQRELPGRFFDCDPEDLFTLIEDMLLQLMSHNDSIPLHPSDLTRFHSRATPGISIGAYLRRMAKYTTLDKPCMLVVLVYIDRVCERLSGFTICSLTVHRFVCAAVVCASKALCDSFSTNTHYARVGGITLAELNLLEKEFLDIIDWRLTVTAPVMQHYYASLVQMHLNYTLGPPKGPMPTMFTGARSPPP
ncbi:hypothetical protein CBS9595_002921 [Malassezia furfur]|nr:hypothetical protein CBS9595_002921 [Malassezia furfur]